MVTDVVRRAIHGYYAIRKRKSAFILDKNIKLHVGAYVSFGFSLDNVERPPFPFFKDNPPRHLTKMCDAIVLAEYNRGLYVILIEQKTGNQADYEKQLTNGKLFCEWLISLCQKHGYHGGEPIAYYGVLVWEPRILPAKGTTVHIPPVALSHSSFEKYFDIQNENDIDLVELVSA